MASDKPDTEETLNQLGVVLDTVDKLSDGYPDDPATKNVLIGLHESLCSIYADFKVNIQS